MRQAVLAFFLIVLYVGGCGSDGGDCGSSAPGESCAKTADCACGLRCRDQVCSRDSGSEVCQDIIKRYQEALADSTARSCSSAPDCYSMSDVCVLDPDAPIVVNVATRDRLWVLEEEWEESACRDVCSGFGGSGGPDCVDSGCQL
jgi:hypothetical protein